jgi:transglutaminase-like putative cysteine protease
VNKLKIEPILQINTAVLVVLGTLLLGMGQQNWVYPALAVSAAVCSVVFVDFKRAFRLTRRASGYFAAAACLWLIAQMVRNVEQSHLLNVANTLILLQSILLFQRKRVRVYRQLIVLSLLQVIVAAALNMGAGFGLLLIGYIVAAIMGLALFYSYCEMVSLSSKRKNMATTNGRTDGANGALGSFDWHATSDASVFVLTRSFLGRIAWMISLSVLGSVVLFFAIPRFSNRAWQSPQLEHVVTVGFTEEVQLDDIGRILENPEQVMRVDFNELSGSAYSVNDEPYFRGTVLTDYTHGRGHWRQSRISEPRRPLNRMNAPDLSSVVVQTITLQPGSHSIIFSVAPCHSLPPPHRQHPLLISPHTRQLTLENDHSPMKESFRYELGTTAFRDGRQSPWLAVLTQPAPSWELPGLLRPWHPSEATAAPAVLSSIKDLADQVIADAELTSGTAYERALALERHFLNSNRYRYSLDMSKFRNRQFDPIVDFLDNHRTGHCEYFAAGLVLMLRSQGIPARLVIGYKGGEFNGVGGFYIVRQLHAHAWVEAYLPPGEVPAGSLPPQEDRGLGAWLRLDPTPSGSGAVAHSRAPWIQTISQVYDYFQVLWDDYVLGLNSSRQQQTIYGPLVYAGESAVYFLFGEELWHRRWNWIKRQWHSIITGRWITWQSIVLLCVLAPLIYIERRALRATLRPLWQIFMRRARRTRGSSFGEQIYGRLEKVLARQGFRRQPAQTHREFASAVGGRLAETDTSVHVAGVPRCVTDAFYRVRFGGQTLGIDEIAGLENSLLELEKAMAT